VSDEKPNQMKHHEKVGGGAGQSNEES